MPKDAYFHNHGKKVFAEMVRSYGRDKGERVFYATANKQDQAPRKKRKVRRKR